MITPFFIQVTRPNSGYALPTFCGFAFVRFIHGRVRLLD
jgi:hypothetical protein